MLTNEELLFFKKNGYFPNPKIVQIEITNYCPLHCKQCYKQMKNLYIDLKLLKKIVDEAADIGIKAIMLNGGEPLAHPQFLDIVKYICERGITPTCFTSGCYIDQQFIDEIRKLPLKLELSFNGSNEYINGRSRDGFEITLSAAKLLCQNNIRYGVNWVARHDNVKDLPKLIKKLKVLKCETLSIEENKITALDELQSAMDIRDYGILREIIIKHADFIQIHNCYNMLGRFAYKLPSHSVHGCQAGKLLVYVSEQGEFAPCSHLNYLEKFDSLHDYWEKSQVLNKIRNDNMNAGICGKCKRKCKYCRAAHKETITSLDSPLTECVLYQEEK